MFCAVDGQPASRRRQACSPNEAPHLKTRRIKAQHPRLGTIQCFVETTHQLFPALSACTFVLQRFQLTGVERTAFRVREKTIETARDMANLKGNRRQFRGSRVYLVGSETVAPARDILARLLESVQHSTLHKLHL